VTFNSADLDKIVGKHLQASENTKEVQQEAIDEERFYAGLHKEAVPSAQSKLADKLENYERKLVDVKLREEDIKDRQQDRSERQRYAQNIFYLLATWLMGLGILLLLEGGHKIYLGENTIIAIITGTTIDIIALMAIVAKYLFPTNGNGNSK